jgi:hypothetical protein
MSRDKIMKACELKELEIRGQTTNNNDTATPAITKYKFSKIRTWPMWIP